MDVFIAFFFFIIAMYLFQENWTFRKALKKYKPIMSIEKVVKARNNEVVGLIKKKLNLDKECQLVKDQLHSVQENLKIYLEKLDIVESGFYEPQYNLLDSDKYKHKLEQIKEKQKNMVRNKEAIICRTEWTVSGSKREGQKMTNRGIKLGLNAFNVQCDNAILKVNYKNILNMENRIEKIRDNIDKLLAPSHCSITEKYFNLKIKELHLAYEYEEKKQEEKEEQRQIKEQLREEQRAEAEIRKAQMQAEETERKLQKKLDEERLKLKKEKTNELKRRALEKRIQALEFQLEEAHQNKDRALSMAQQTKRGHIYIISNIGSFGENVFKIGMTRRLEPKDRVKELGDASVPFSFDIHAMIWSENAPSLEKELHNNFNKKRRNKINLRKEFFNVHLEEIESYCNNKGIKVQFTKLAEAREYRETISIDKQDSEYEKAG